MKALGFKFYSSIILLMMQQAVAQPSAVTYVNSNGRLGDHLSAYANTRWFSYKYNVEFLYRPFKDSDKFAFHSMHKAFDFKKDASKFSSINYLSEKKRLHNTIDINYEDTLYVVPFFVEVYNYSFCNSDPNVGKFRFLVDWEDEKFIAILRNEIASMEPLTRLKLPQDRHHVAVHVRTGIQFDKIPEENLIGCNSCPLSTESSDRNVGPASKQIGIADKLFPLKFPPYAYYIEQLERLSEMLNHEPMYVHIFTDSPNPGKIANLFKKYLNKETIEFGFRLEENGDMVNIIDDFFALGQFDYLIRGKSGFAFMAEKLFRYKIVIYPFEHGVINGRNGITQVVTKVRSAQAIQATKLPAGLNFDWERLCENA